MKRKNDLSVVLKKHIKVNYSRCSYSHDNVVL